MEQYNRESGKKRDASAEQTQAYNKFSELAVMFSKKFPASKRKDFLRPEPSPEDIQIIDSVKKVFPHPEDLINMIIDNPPELRIDRSVINGIENFDNVHPEYKVEPLEEDVKSFIEKMPDDAQKGLEKNGIHIILNDNEKQILYGSTRSIIKFLRSEILNDGLDEISRDLYEKNLGNLLDLFDKKEDGSLGIYLEKWQDRLRNNKLKGNTQSKATDGIMFLSTIISFPEDIRKKLSENYFTTLSSIKSLQGKDRVNKIVASSESALELLFGKT